MVYDSTAKVFHFDIILKLSTKGMSSRVQTWGQKQLGQKAAFRRSSCAQVQRCQFVLSEGDKNDGWDSTNQAQPELERNISKPYKVSLAVPFALFSNCSLCIRCDVASDFTRTWFRKGLKTLIFRNSCWFFSIARFVINGKKKHGWTTKYSCWVLHPGPEKKWVCHHQSSAQVSHCLNYCFSLLYPGFNFLTALLSESS